MSDKFNGFSQDEIKRLSGTKSAKSTVSNTETTMKQAFRGHHNGLRRMPEKWAKANDASGGGGGAGGVKKQQQQQTSKAINIQTAEKKFPGKSLPDDETLEEVNLDCSLSKSIEEALFYPTMASKPKVNGAKLSGKSATAPAPSSADDSSILKLPLDSNVTSSASSVLDDDDGEDALTPASSQPTTATTTGSSSLNTDSPFRGISLKDFETHRRLIEEQNKQKKQLLYKAIEHHSQKTAAEARKIEEIKCELAKLDNDLAVDVALLRKQIDNACVHFATVEKQYVKIESQFLKAKIELHNAAEKKELLTEHLCTVIAHNEDRKAQKLSELMHKVGLSPTGDYDLLPTSAGGNEENIDK